jgi:hypothetical protein
VLPSLLLLPVHLAAAALSYFCSCCSCSALLTHAPPPASCCPCCCRITRFFLQPWADQRATYGRWWLVIKKEAKHYWVRSEE